jgi:hypothetical protein
MRIKAGDPVELFDGQGTSWSATVTGIERNEVTLRLDSRYTEKISQQPVVTLAVALPKGERQKWLIEKNHRTWGGLPHASNNITVCCTTNVCRDKQTETRCR